MSGITPINSAFSIDSRTPGADTMSVLSGLTGDIFGNAGAPLQRGVTADIHFGTVLDSTPFWGVYTVAVPGQLTLICNDGTGIGGSAYYGAKGHSVLAPHTQVVVATYSGSNTGTIIAAPPPMNSGERFSPFSDAHFLGSGAVGLRSGLFDHITNDKEAAGVMEYASGAPIDQIPGDQSVMSPLGVGWLVSMTMMLLRAQDDCSIEMYYSDSLLRLHGRNFEQFTGAAERREFEDEGELHSVRHVAKFPWELAGTKDEGGTPFREGNVSSDDSFEAAVEPVEPEQTGAWRMLFLEGYLGDMYRVQVQRPSDAFKSKTATYGGFDASDGTAPAALSEVAFGSDGTLSLASVKQIISRKTTMIPALVQNRLPDDGESGDSPDNYEPPEAAEAYQWEGEEEVGNIRALGMQDYLAHVFMWYSLMTVRAHVNDWVVGEIPAKSDGWPEMDPLLAQEELMKLQDGFWAGMPKMEDVYIDARVGTVKYGATTSTIAQLDDGSIMLEDGWGSTIFMGRGNIIIDPVGNLMIRAGQRIINWSGLDNITRARGSIDVTATEGSYRLVSGKNIQVLAGNGGSTGGILLESRSTSQSKDFNAVGDGVVDNGITLLAKNSLVATLADQVYIGTSGETSGASVGICLDASRGKRTIYEVGGNIIRSAASDMFLDLFSGAKKISFKSPTIMYTQTMVSAFDSTVYVIKGSGSGSLIVEQDLVAFKGSIVGRSGVLAVDGPIMGSFAYGKEGVGYYAPGGKPTMVSPVEDDLLEEASDQLDRADPAGQKKQIEMVASTARSTGDQVEKSIRNDRHPGGKKLLQSMGVSLRTVEDYNAGDFKLAKAGWQVRLADQLVAWEEKPVTAGGGTGVETYPFPGETYYTNPGSLVEVELTLTDPVTGVPKPAGEEYRGAASTIKGGGSLNEYSVFPGKNG